MQCPSPLPRVLQTVISSQTSLGALRANTGPLRLTHHLKLPINAASVPGAEVDLIWEPFVDRLIKTPDFQRSIFLRKKQPLISHRAQVSRAWFLSQLHQAELSRPPFSEDSLHNQGCNHIAEAFILIPCFQQSPLFQGEKVLRYQETLCRAAELQSSLLPHTLSSSSGGTLTAAAFIQAVFLSLTSSPYKKVSTSSSEVLQLPHRAIYSRFSLSSAYSSP